MMLSLKILLFATLAVDLTATLIGKTTSQAGVPLVDVEVLAINVETGALSRTRTNDEGNYRLPNLAPGFYRMQLRRPGFRTIVITGLELTVQQIASVPLQMQIGSESESTTMMEGAPLLQAETATLGQTIDYTMISELPTLTRNPYELIGLTPGAIPTLSARGVGFAINGQRAESATFLLDGSEDNTNLSQKNPGQAVPKEAVREYRVLTNSFPAEYGRSAGFVGNLVTRSGTNQLHGSAYAYMRNSALAANSFENNAAGKPKNAFNGHQIGGSLGGPIREDKAFFFGTLESVRVRGSDTLTGYVPTPELVAISSRATQSIFGKYPLPPNRSQSQVIKRTVTPFGGGASMNLPAFALASRNTPADSGAGAPQDRYMGTVRTDYTLNASTAITGRYAFEDGMRFAVRRQIYTPDLDQPLFTRNHNAAFNLTRVWSSALISETRFSFSRLLSHRPNAGPDGLFQEYGIAGESVVQLPTGRQSEGGPQSVFQIHQIGSWIRKNHHFKVGGEILHYRDSVEIALPGVWPQFSGVQGFVDGVLSSAEVFTNFTLEGASLTPNRSWNLRYTDWALFAQDSWRMAQRLTLTPGVRWEYFGVQSSAGNEKSRDVNFYPGQGNNYYERFANGSFLSVVDAPGEYRNRFVRPDRNNIAPRLGLAFDLTGEGTTIIRAGAGVFYDATFARIPPLITRRVSFINVPFEAAMLENPYAMTGPPLTTLRPVIDRVDPDRRNSFAIAWHATVEQEVDRKLVLSASYAASKGSRLELSVLENGIGSGRYVNRPEERLLPDYSLFYTLRSEAQSSYHSLQLKAEGRSIGPVSLRLGASYTWSHSIDNSSSRRVREEGTFQDVLMDPDNLALDRASSNFDMRHRLVTFFIFDVPQLWKQSKVGSRITEGWQLSGILSFQSGLPFQLID
ncbi:MAG TPA: TonB-dependent receptor, partial [Terriglobia bacterium]|nr:TonB-dependent receptor [Terriglobia bacterium]